jgi:hypothetical protein
MGAAPEGYVRLYARVAILGLGSDGELRVGRWIGSVILPKSDDHSVLDALSWSDIRLRNVPPRPIVMTEWTGSQDPRDVASPARVVEALGELASKVAADSQRDLTLLQRYL